MSPVCVTGSVSNRKFWSVYVLKRGHLSARGVFLPMRETTESVYCNTIITVLNVNIL